MTTGDFLHPISIDSISSQFTEELSTQIAAILHTQIAIAYLSVGTTLYEMDFSNPDTGLVVQRVGESSFDLSGRIAERLIHYVSATKVSRPRPEPLIIIEVKKP